MVLPRPDTLTGDFYSLRCPAVIPSNKGNQQLEVESIGAAGALLVGSESLRPNWVTRIVLACPGGSLDLWVNVKACRACQDQHRVEVQPFALSGEAAKGWSALVQYARSQQPAPLPVPVGFDVASGQPPSAVEPVGGTRGRPSPPPSRRGSGR